jgi:hypothetical protein
MLYIKELLMILSLRLSVYGFADPVCMGLKVILGCKYASIWIECNIADPVCMVLYDVLQSCVCVWRFWGVVGYVASYGLLVQQRR